MRDWALREKNRVLNKYGPENSSLRVKRGVEEKRAFSTAGTSTAPLASSTNTLGGAGNATSTMSGNSSLPTSPVGLVKVNNFEADL